MKLLGFFSLLISPRDPGSYSYFPLLKLVFFLRSMSLHGKFSQPLTSPTYNNCCNAASK